MMSGGNGTISTSGATAVAGTSSATGTTQSPGLKAYFKTPEGRYKLQNEKSHPSGILQYTNGKSATQVSIANLKDKPAPSVAGVQPSGFSASIGARSMAAKFLGSTNGGRALGFVGGNGGSKGVSSTTRTGSVAGTASSSSAIPSNFHGKGNYLIFNFGDAIFISDLQSQDKDPIKSIHFGNVSPVCHSFDQDAKDGHDTLIGLSSGDVYSFCLRHQLQDPGKKLVGAHHYNKDGCVNNTRCTNVAWVPGRDGVFVVAHTDGNLFVYEKNKEGSGDSSFPAIKDPNQFSVAHARYSKCNPVARWHISQGSINSIAFSNDGAYLATVGRDGYLRIFNYSTEQLACGGKSYYGALLCCAWSNDNRYILTGGEDDMVQVWSMEDRRVVAWGEGHSSWVSGVAFDPYWSPPNSNGQSETVMYRFGSVGQDTQLLLWDLEMDELVITLRRYPAGGSPTYSSGSQSSHWDKTGPTGLLQPSPTMRDMPKLSPLVVHRVHAEPLSSLIFTAESILTACREGHVKMWARPVGADIQPEFQ